LELPFYRYQVAVIILDSQSHVPKDSLCTMLVKWIVGCGLFRDPEIVECFSGWLGHTCLRSGLLICSRAHMAWFGADNKVTFC
jgi:hypothetical protein